MNPHLFWLLAALGTSPQVQDWQTIYRPDTAFAAAVRGQTPTYDEDPQSYGSPPAVAPNGGAPWGYQPAPMMQDPFLGQPPAQPYGGFSPGMNNAGPYGTVFGANGPQPFRLGWLIRGDVGYLPEESTTAGGKFEVFEFNAAFRHTTPLPTGWIFWAEQQFNLRSWQGPTGVGLPGSVYRFGWDIALETPAHGPVSVLLAFNPSLNSDFETSLTRDAWNFDGRGILFYRHSPQWMFALGAGFWDRVDDQVIPYAGFVYTPDDRWEFRILFPESQISYFLGNFCGVSQWVYATGEYHVEAYQIQEQLTGTREKIQIEDWRILLGLRADSGRVAGFIEGGWVFGRDVAFLHGTPGFDISSGFIARLGLRF